MPQPTFIILILLTLLLIKHLFTDFFMQSKRMMTDRDIYLHRGRLQHAGLHGMFSFVCFLVVGANAIFALVICIIEVAVHYHIDWVKGWHSVKTGYGPEEPAYWRAFGTDQLAHQLTYVAMIWVWVVWSG